MAVDIVIDVPLFIKKCHHADSSPAKGKTADLIIKKILCKPTVITAQATVNLS